MIKGAIGCSILSSGCIDFTSDPKIQIVQPKSGAETGEEFTLSVNVSNYDIRDPSIPVNSDNTGYIVVTVDEKLEEGSEPDSDKVSVDEWLDGQKQDQVDVNVPGDHTIRTYVADNNRRITETVTSVEITSSFNVPSTITIGENQSLNVDPNYVTIPSGTELTFNWRVNGVNLLVVESPNESDWKGLDNPQPQGYSYEHSFETPGTYRFRCEPHGDVMQGTIVVV